MATSVPAQPEQLALFDFGVSVGALRQFEADLRAGHSRAAGTVRAYASDWRDFAAWCRAAGRVSLPAEPDTVRLYLCDQLDRWKVSTVERRLAAIVVQHRDAGAKAPTDDDTRLLLRAARRQRGTKPAQKTAVTVADLRVMLRECARSALGIRDRALLLVGFATGLRRSELVALDRSDVRMVSQGAVVAVRRAKNDQEGAGREIGLFRAKTAALCPVRALEHWLSVLPWDGPLFVSCGPCGELTRARLAAEGVAEVVKRYAERAGLDPDVYGAHSLRAGMVTSCLEAGVPESVVMRRSGHKSVAVLHKYLRPASVFSTNPLAAVL